MRINSLANLLFVHIALSVAQYSIDLLIEKCGKTFYFDSTSLACESCPENNIQSSTGSSCVCEDGFYEDYSSRFDFFKTCITCPTGQAPAQDNSTCYECRSPATLLNGHCVCPEGYKTISTDLNGNNLGYITCELCPENSYQGPNSTSIWECASCLHFAMIYDSSSTPWKCVCSDGWRAAGDSCVSNEDISALPSTQRIDYARVVRYSNVEDVNGVIQQENINSDTFSYLYYKAAIGCQVDQDPTQCQVLGNLCVLQLYDERTPVCQLFQSITASRSSQNDAYGDSNWAEGMPWLYYSQNGEEVLTTSGKLDVQVAFTDVQGANKTMSFYLARYDIYGNYLGMQTLGSELSLCPLGYEDIENMLKVGTLTETVCEFYLYKLLDQASLPQEANAFFELYVLGSNGQLIDVPVLMRNFIDSSGNSPNSADSEQSSWRLTRRFFIYDTLSGIEDTNGFVSGGQAQFVRWAQVVKLKTMLDAEQESALYVPYLDISYLEKESTIISSETTSEVEFQVIYARELNRFWRGVLISFVIFHLIIFIRVILDLVFMSQNNPPSLLTTPRFVRLFFYKFVMSAMDWWSELIFWLLFFISMTWFISYKWSSSVAVLLPNFDQWRDTYVPFFSSFALVTLFKLIVTVVRVLEQSSVDLFFIDWEAPKYPGAKIPVWRSIFLANEYNELQVDMRYLYPETTLLWMTFFIKGLGWEYLAKADPDMDRGTDTLEPVNLVLFFFLSAFLFLCIAALQYLVQLVNAGFFGNKYQEFMDLCSVSNISVIIMDQYLHGYYIHGEAPWVASDVVLSQLKKNLDGEGEGKGLNRGISDKYKGHQSFEIYIPAQFREEIDKIYASQISKHKLQEISEEQEKAKNLQYNAQKEIKSGPEDAQNLFQAHIQHSLNYSSNDFKREKLADHFKTLITNTKMNDKKLIVEKWCCERLLGMVPSQVALTSLKEAGLLVKDYFTRWPSFAKVLYCTLDYQVLILNILIFNVIYALTKNTIVSLFIVYFLEKMLMYLRSKVGQRNIAKKTLIDKCFLI